MKFENRFERLFTCSDCLDACNSVVTLSQLRLYSANYAAAVRTPSSLTGDALPQTITVRGGCINLIIRQV